MEEILVEPRKGRKVLVNLGLFIKDYLTEHGEACQQDIHESYRNALREIYERAGRRFTKMDGRKYHSFTRFFSFLKQLDFVKVTGREEPSIFQERFKESYPEREMPVKISPRTYYKLTDEGEKAPDVDWSNPLRTLYPKFDAVYYSTKSKEYIEQRKLKGLPARRYPT